MIANCTRCSGLHSELAPTSSKSVGFADFVGIKAASAGRSTPGNIPITILAVAIAAPVLPAETNPSPFPSFTNFVPILKELFFLRLTDVITGSPMPITSAASTSSMPRSPSPRQPQRRFDDLRLPNQNYPDCQVARSSQRSIDLGVRRVVATHRVENDFSRQPGFILRLISHRR